MTSADLVDPGSGDGFVERLMEKYADSPALRALVRISALAVGVIFPPASLLDPLDDALAAAVFRSRQQKLREWFEALAGGARLLSPEVIQSNDFLHAYFATMRAAMRSRRAEKAALFVRLLLGAVALDEWNSDTYEEFLQMLDTLSPREFEVLVTLKDFEMTSARTRSASEGPAIENPFQAATKFWPAFQSRVATSTGLPSEQLAPFLVALSRTGCYSLYAGLYLDYVEGVGHTTALFARFLDWVSAGNCDPLQET